LNNSSSQYLELHARHGARSTAQPLVAGGFASILLFVFGTYWLSALGIGAAVYYLVRLIQESGTDLPIESFILVMACIQWIVGPVLTYAGFSDHYKYHMYVPEADYMLLAVPAVMAMSLGLYALRPRRRPALVAHYGQATREIVTRYPYLPFYLIGTGFAFSFLSSWFPPSLAFPSYILSNVKYIGLIYLLFSDRVKGKSLVLFGAFFITFLSSLRGAMFHDLLLWFAFIGMYAAYIIRPSMAKKLAVVVLGFLFIFILQAAKDEYRAKLEREGRSDYVQKFLSSVDERMRAEQMRRLDELAQSDNIERVVVRINQGWIISRIMQLVPSSIPHANGETVLVAIKASVLPRLLFPDKPKAGGEANFEKYTRYYLQSNTSMGISLLGEAYINFGLYGAWGFMFIFGLISSFVIRKIFMLAATYPTIWLWFPLVMLHFVKAETELLVQLNFLVKSIILVYLFVWANKHFLRLKL
jgi:hypothetical protein